MKKLLKLKSWLTLPEAAKHLSTVLSEDVTEADILQLGLERQLTLSVNLVNHAFAKIGKIIPLNECESEEIPAFSFDGPTDKTITFYPNAVKLNDGTAVKLQPEVKSIAGLWDLPMIGGEYHTISNRYHQLTGGPVTELIAIEGSFVSSADGTVAQLVERTNTKKLRNDSSDYFPAGELPDDCAIVVRPQCLRDLEAQLVERESTAKEKPLGERERASYQRIIGAMLAELTSRVDHDPAKPKPRYKTQSDLITELVDFHPTKEGLSRSKLESVFAEAKRVLDSD